MVVFEFMRTNEQETRMDSIKSCTVATEHFFSVTPSFHMSYGEGGSSTENNQTYSYQSGDIKFHSVGPLRDNSQLARALIRIGVVRHGEPRSKFLGHHDRLKLNKSYKKNSRCAFILTVVLLTELQVVLSNYNDKAVFVVIFHF